MSTGKRPRPVRREPEPAPPPKPRGNRPEKKFGPYRGIEVAVWLNTVQTEEGPRQVRSITISPRRYYDREREEWRDAKSFRPADLEVLIFALRQAQAYIFTTPIPGQKPDEDVPY